MNKQIKDISITLFGPTLTEGTYSNIRYSMVINDDPRFRITLQKDMWDDKEIQAISKNLWRRCCDLLEKAEA